MEPFLRKLIKAALDINLKSQDKVSVFYIN